MKQLIKSYHIFVPYVWGKWILYLVYPMVGMLLLYGAESLFHDERMSVVIAATFVVSVELYFDMAVFGGISSKETNKLEYLKTSVKGMTVLRNSLVTDALRRFLSVVFIVMMAKCFTAYQEMRMEEWAVCILGNLFLVELGLFFERYVTFMTWVHLVNMIVSALAIFFTMSLFGAGIGYLFVVLVLYLATVIGGRAFILKKVGKSYYDEAD